MPAAAVYQVVTPWVEADLPKLRYKQTADVAIITCYGYPMQRLRRFAHDDWRLDEAPIGAQITAPTITVVATDAQNADADYVAQPYTYVATALNALGQESPASAPITVTNDLGLKGDYNTVTISVVPDGAVEYRVYQVRSGVNGFVGRIASGVTFKDDNILADYSNGPPTATNPFADGEYPSVCALHEGRLFVARTPTRPSAIYGSKTEDLFNFDKSSPLQATDSLALSIRGEKVNAIEHLASLGDALLSLTSDSIASVLPTNQGFLSPLSLKRRFESFRGVGKARPELIDDTIFYATSRGNQVRTLGYTFEKDGYKGNNISVFASHFFTSYSLSHFVFCDVPSGVLWTVRSDGKMPTLTWQQEQDVWGWTLCETRGYVESACTVSENGVDTLYASIRRTINGETVRYVERLTVPYWIDENWTDVQDAVVMDAAVTVRSDTPITNVSRIFHLEGEEVSVLADGYVVKDRSVVNGVLTPPLTDPAQVVSIGIPYLSYIRTLPVVGQIQGYGSNKGQKQIVAKANVELLNTRGGLMGYGIERAPEQLYDIEYPRRTGSPPPLFSGVITADDFPGGTWDDAKVTIAQVEPLPLVVLSIYPAIESGG